MKKKRPASERELLKRKAAAHRFALGQVATRLAGALSIAINPPVWVRKYPWKTTILAALVGMKAGKKFSAPKGHTEQGPRPPGVLSRAFHFLEALGGMIITAKIKKKILQD